MARVSPVGSDNESELASAKEDSNSKLAKSAEPMDVDEGGGESDEEESEYEIEAILDAKRGSFPEGRMGFFVKWKGYGEEENSWVDEKDAGNADDLIAEYWRKNPKQKKGPRKSTDIKSPKRSRKSGLPEDASDVGSMTKKRGRKPRARPESDLDNGRDEGENDDSRPVKKSRKNATKAKAKDARDQDDLDVMIGDMNKYMNVASWETLIATVDTIEREDDGSLTVYFVLNTGEHVKENSRLCAERFPQKLIKFYETNLRWRTAAESEADA